jgi:hypothetical protein
MDDMAQWSLVCRLRFAHHATGGGILDVATIGTTVSSG